ncbi:helix-turn-helix domain-containing protein [Epilithonimonas ginsengisoli]|uniref:Helix-turn-helix domain-containing protein n=1 Tax=Epilithonimonas ginsengisoli TaxID=1245592 RepID=A0ABU4JKY3_9FLAO|nr:MULTISPECIES: helix-turn-helix domain-containing protein [Chryseobacterium group]MBV6881403.1 helix-turn-helix domain-containing protein [Epilithonimonas sp. FP105]MDW8550371.1 helix-turn-helix domain-containing protein [Epilithonimonas ginsengisoli]OAH74207.1 transposase [Chryseobacterium sp. FP211-J200]
MENQCPKCNNDKVSKSGIIKGKQRFYCKNCHYNFTVKKLGKQIDDYYVTKALQLYLEGLSYREIERIIGVSHVSISSWIKKYNITRPPHSEFHPVYKVLKQNELIDYISQENNLQNSGLIITQFADKYMLIKWERFKK